MSDRVMPLLVLVALVLSGCSWSGKTVDDTDSDAPIPSGHDDDCGETPPVIESVWIEDGGIREFEGVAMPSLRIHADTTDADGDLTYYEMAVWWDLEVDGHVELDGLPLEVYGTLSDTACSVDDVDLSMILGLRGGDPPYSTEVEFGVRIKDDLGNASNNGVLMTASFTTPDAEGSYP